MSVKGTVTRTPFKGVLWQYFLCKKRKKLSFRQDLLTEYSSNDNINYIIMIIKQKVNEKNKNIKILGGKDYEYFSCRRTRENGERLS